MLGSMLWRMRAWVYILAFAASTGCTKINPDWQGVAATTSAPATSHSGSESAPFADSTTSAGCG